MADLNEKLKELNNTKDTTEEFDAADIEANKIMGIFAYLSWLVLIPIFVAKESKFARYHANQGITLAIAEIIAFVILGILAKIPFIGWIFAIVEWLLGLACIILACLGIINAANGKAKELPFVGSIKILK